MNARILIKVLQLLPNTILMFYIWTANCYSHSEASHRIEHFSWSCAWTGPHINTPTHTPAAHLQEGFNKRWSCLLNSQLETTLPLELHFNASVHPSGSAGTRPHHGGNIVCILGSASGHVVQSLPRIPLAFVTSAASESRSSNEEPEWKSAF